MRAPAVTRGDTARVVVATRLGGPEVLSLVEQPIGAPGPGEVLLDVRAAGVNPRDWKSYSPSRGDPLRVPLRLGFEAAGEVVEVGPRATGPLGPIGIGDEVIGFRLAGAYAERLVVPASAVVPKPSILDWAQASGLMLAGATAIHALTATSVQPGDTVLVHGASGGVGLMLIQLAQVRGARVIGTASEASEEVLTRLGAEPVRYGRGLIDRIRAVAPDGVDVAVDAAGTDEAIEVSLALVGERARIVTLVSRGIPGIRLLGNRPGGEPGTGIREAARLKLIELVERGELTVVVAGTYALDEVAAAHRNGGRGHSHGKLVLLC